MRVFVVVTCKMPPKQTLLSPVPPKKYDAIPPKKQKPKKKKEASPAVMHKRSQPIARKRYVPAPAVVAVAPSEWECKAGSSGAQKMLNIDTKDYYGPLMTPEMRKELDALLPEGRKVCLSSDEAGPHAGMHCGLRHLLHLRRKL